MTIVQTNSLPLPLETFTQPCAEQRKSLVEQTEEITVELLLESNDIQLFGNKLRFLVAPQNERELQQCNSFFITLCICCKTVGRNSTPDYAAGQTIRPRKRFPAFRSGSRKKYEGKTGIGLNDYFCIGTNRRKHEKTLDRLHIPDTLEFQVVDRHDGLDIPEELTAVEFVLEMHRDKSRLPVVAVDDIRLEADHRQG